MALGRRKRESQAQLWVATQNLTAPGHPFYKKLNRVLDKHGFDAFVEAQCAKYYAEGVGRPGIPPGVYFRLLMIGYFEGINSERAIAWRVADSLSLRQFLGYELDQATPDHSSVSRTRRLMDYQTHHEVFDWVLKVLAKTKLLKGKTLGVDATTLDANAAMRSIVRRDSGESYDEFLTELAKASGIETPTREDLAKVDKKRPKKGSNKDWEHPHDPDARITRMKDGRTHMAHKVEHAVDMDTQAIVAVTLPSADEGDTESLPWTLLQTELNLAKVSQDPEAKKRLHPNPSSEVVADKGYHSNEVLVNLSASVVCAAASVNRIEVVADGKTKPTHDGRYMPIVVAFAVTAGSRCGVSAASFSNGRLLIYLKPAVCGGCFYEADKTFSNVCSFTCVDSTSVCSCASSSVKALHGA